MKNRCSAFKFNYNLNIPHKLFRNMKSFGKIYTFWHHQVYLTDDSFSRNPNFVNYENYPF